MKKYKLETDEIKNVAHLAGQKAVVSENPTDTKRYTENYLAVYNSVRNALEDYNLSTTEIG